MIIIGHNYKNSELDEITQPSANPHPMGGLIDPQDFTYAKSSNKSDSNSGRIFISDLTSKSESYEDKGSDTADYSSDIHEDSNDPIALSNVELANDNSDKVILPQEVCESYSGFKDSTGLPAYDTYLNKSTKNYRELAKGDTGSVVMMSPDQYLKDISSKVFHSKIKTTLRQVDQSNVDSLAQKLKLGTKLDMPMLDLRLGREAQEGRHRALAAKKAGLSKIPVLVVKDYDSSKLLNLPSNMEFCGGYLVITHKDGSKDYEHTGYDLGSIQHYADKFRKDD